jgi:hypothetical protein
MAHRGARRREESVGRGRPARRPLGDDGDHLPVLAGDDGAGEELRQVDAVALRFAQRGTPVQSNRSTQRLSAIAADRVQRTSQFRVAEDRFTDRRGSRRRSATAIEAAGLQLEPRCSVPAAAPSRRSLGSRNRRWKSITSANESLLDLFPGTSERPRRSPPSLPTRWPRTRSIRLARTERMATTGRPMEHLATQLGRFAPVVFPRTRRRRPTVSRTPPRGAGEGRSCSARQDVRHAAVQFFAASGRRHGGTALTSARRSRRTAGASSASAGPETPAAVARVVVDDQAIRNWFFGVGSVTYCSDR